MSKEESEIKNQYIYIVQASSEATKCKIDKTNDLDWRLKEYNNMTAPALEERGFSTKDVLQKAKAAKNDEFYTRYEDVEKELDMYPKSVWKNKVVFCNCDDAVDDDNDKRRTSAFALYFLKNFNVLGLKKLVCTHYAGKVDLFHQGPKGYIFTKDRYR